MGATEFVVDDEEGSELDEAAVNGPFFSQGTSRRRLRLNRPCQASTTQR